MPRTLLAVLLALTALHASAQQSLQLELGAVQRNLQLPSASGIVAQPGGFFAIGDDAPALYQLDIQFNITARTLIKNYPLAPNGRINKKVKPDFEAHASVQQGKQLLHIVLGSGSKRGVRENSFVLSADGQYRHEQNLAPFYRQLKTAAAIDELNIEGLALDGKQAYLLNRGNGGGNIVFAVSQEDLLAHLQGKGDVPKAIGVYRVQLPVVAKFEAGLSGADYWPQAKSLVYTASVEATGDAYNDGQILGSFVGLIPLDQLKAGQALDLSQSAIPLLNKQGQPLMTKAESIAVSRSSTSRIDGAIASDNDDGSSEFFHFSLSRR